MLASLPAHITITQCAAENYKPANKQRLAGHVCLPATQGALAESVYLWYDPYRKDVLTTGVATDQ